MHPWLSYADVDTPTPGPTWLASSDSERLALVVAALQAPAAAGFGMMEPVTTKDDGQVILRMRETLPASQRGTVLLDLEEHLKATVDPAVAVWLEAHSDRNALRNLRGIEVKE